MTWLFGLRDSTVEVNNCCDKWFPSKFIYQENLSHFLNCALAESWIASGFASFPSLLAFPLNLFSFSCTAVACEKTWRRTVKNDCHHSDCCRRSFCKTSLSLDFKNLLLMLGLSPDAQSSNKVCIWTSAECNPLLLSNYKQPFVFCSWTFRNHRSIQDADPC